MASTQKEEEEAAAEVVLKFVPFASAVESAFWVRYCREKLEKIQLDESPVSLALSYAVGRSSSSTTAATPRLQCENDSLLLINTTSTDDGDAKTTATSTNNECVLVSGNLIGFNTLEAFQKSDKNELLRQAFVSKFFHDNDSVVLDSLSSTVLLTFADLKQHKVVYWFGMPALVPSSSIRATLAQETDSLNKQKLQEQIEAMRRRALKSKTSRDGLPPYFIYSEKKAFCEPLSKESYAAITKGDDASMGSLVFGFFDSYNTTSTPTSSDQQQQSTMMGWPMRNLMAYLCFHLNLGGTYVQVLSYRPKVVRRLSLKEEEVVAAAAAATTSSGTDAVLVEAAAATAAASSTTASNNSGDHSILLTVQVPHKEDYKVTTTSSAGGSGDNDQYKVVGWELNARSKPGPRSVNLRPLLDPKHLSIQAADLNLKLMKWRMIPNLNVELLQSTKVLLIGAGTLGCNVARVLLGWGIRHFKIVDYGKVSYSNPVRQSLFTLDDCHAEGGSGRPKAAAAAEALQSIAADVHSEGITLSIPMPGHPESDDAIRHSVETLDTLVQEADAVFLLTDTRESRWLPTVMAAAHNKMLINAALGLDSWLVMRHGASPDASDADQQKQRHGCYFCSDVVAPENSTKNRTLDQQCTVTRPGLALIASSMAVEVMVSLLHHPAKLAAPAPANASSNFSPTVAEDDAAASPLGVIPHQIRGSLVSYTMMTPTFPAFQHCTGCSACVIVAYLKDKVGTVLKSCQTTSGSYLEDVSGLTAFRAEAAEKLVEMEGWDDDSDDE